MDVYNWPIEHRENENKPEIIMILGAFESLHLGHYELFKLAKQLKNQNKNVQIACLLFKNKQNNNEKIFQLKTRIYTLEHLQVDKTIVINFDDNFKNIDPLKFINELKNLNVTTVIAGSDFKFGFNRQGNNQMLKQHFITHIIKEKKVNNNKISSTIIRQLIKEGNLDTTNNLLIEDYAFIVAVKDYKFDFPKNLIKLPAGIYFCNLVYKDIEYHGFIFINYQEKENQVVFLDLDEDILFFDELFIEVIKFFRNINHIAENKIFKSDLQEAMKFFKNNV
ncbi:FAD synthase [Mycoplasma miroungirhinis]|uniref:FAD synthase n=1 Tax=Mycoplasma miroungirhinis TaxID=754516 RepID=A0A6M4JAA6_9MOLU|nr:riboflavin biosynthesis protein [Mycoplasma miroungirhinis]QJR43924.1 riboflavin biosynthesis protein [Mycoplasma miroungirhinis]